MTDQNKTEKAIENFSKESLGNVKVLMIEDDPFISELVLTKLSQHGCVPYSGTTGEEAVELAEQFSPDIIILDLMLPGISGEEILVQLKQNEALKDIPVLVFSNKSDEAEIKNALELGAAKYLVKSATDISKLPDVVLALLK